MVPTTGSAESPTSLGAVSARHGQVEGTPKSGTHVLAVCVTLGQFDDCVALALQQEGEQSALRERKGRG